METEVIVLTNQKRGTFNLAPLGCNTIGNRVARSYSEYMCRTNCLNHTCGGTSPGDRLRSGGYSWSSYAENIAYGQRDAATVMQAWMNSQGHRRNILKTSVIEMGVGHYICDDGTPYWTMVLMSPSISNV